MINKFLNKKSETIFYKFCSLIHILNSKVYIKLNEFLPLLSESSCYSFIMPIKNSFVNMIMNYECIPSLVHKYYDGLILFDKNNKAVTPIYTTLSGDAASMKNIFHSSSSAVYTFEMCPLRKEYPPCVIHMMETNNGSSPKKVVDMFPSITKCLNQHNFMVKFQGTDGDISFDSTHRDFFIKHIQPIINLDFIEIVDKIHDLNSIPISDPMHLIKSSRSRLLQHLLLIDPDSCKCINTALFSEAVNLGPVFTDRSQSGSMKDSYALSIFSWYSFVNTMEKGRFDASYYILPYLFFIESIRSPLLSNETRLEFLSYAFEIFREHLKIIKKIDNNSMFKQRFTSKSLGVLFSDEIFLYRILNTCIALGIAIKYFPENLATQRVGTHDLELFFGTMRLLSYYDNDISNSLRVAAESIIIRQFSNDLNKPIKINKRENEAGITLSEAINSQNNLEFDGRKLTEIVYKLMKGEVVNENALLEIEKMMNNYSTLIKENSKYKIVRIPHLMRGSLPNHRYNLIKYCLSVLPIPKYESAFDFYLQDKKFKKKTEKLNINEWCMKLVASLHGIDHKCINNKFKIPLDYDIDNEKDIEKIIEYITDPLLKSIEHEDIVKLKEEIEKNLNKNKQMFPYDFYDDSWENIINKPLNEIHESENQNNENNEDFISKEAFKNLNNFVNFNTIISKSTNQKKIIKKTAKLSFVLSLRKAMKVLIKIYRKMSQEEFVSKFSSNLSIDLLSTYRKPKNDYIIEDHYQNAINNFLVEN